MRTEGIPFKDTGYFSKLITDYLDAEAKLEPFCGRIPSLPAFREQLDEKLGTYSEESRQLLCRVLEDQYKGLQLSRVVRSNLNALADSGTVTVVTGHQLNLFTGPRFFHYKIATTIALCRQLQKAYPDHIFVPVYWMATEDHDFDEINHFNFRGKEFRWNREPGGAVGRLSTDGLADLAEQFGQDLGPGQRAGELLDLFRKAYEGHPDLASATRYLVNELFGGEGLVILDADDTRLKAAFAAHMEADLFENRAFNLVNRAARELQAADPDYTVQVNPREINLFYLRDGLRERIVESGGSFEVVDTDQRFTADEIRAELRDHPERFSPNVITRPLYQEVILPNLAYVGGGGELAYWLELRSYIEASGVPFPILILRNSALLLSEKQADKADRLGVGLDELFLDQDRLVARKVREISEIDIDFSPQKEYLREQFRGLFKLAEQTDASFLGAVKAQEAKQIKGLENLEKRLLKAQKRKLVDHVDRLVALQNELFPGGGLQERNLNFAGAYLEMGTDWVPSLLKAFDPLGKDFTLLIYQP